MKLKSLKALVLNIILISLTLWGGHARAALITVVNPSFEILPVTGLPNSCGTGCSYSEELIPGWKNIPFLGLGLSSGQFRPGTDVGNTTYFDSLSDGITSVYTSIPGIVQTEGAVVQQGVIYTLLVDVGYRKDASPGGVPRLKVNDVFYDGIGTPVVGGWAPFTATYVGLAADVGQPITIFLDSASFQGNFDNVRLHATPSAVPLPQTWALLLPAIGMVGMMKRRKA